MGKWNRRQYSTNRRSRYRDYNWSPPRETHQDPELGVWQDNVPMWEKKFCFLSGVPWEKVLGAKKFMHCQGNILEWDDSASKETFHNAKECYWAKLNGRECEIRLPDPDAYIQDIDWNPDIDPALIEDLRQSFFVPTDNESRSEDTIQETKISSFGSLKNPGGRLENSGDQWGCDNAQSSGPLNNKTEGCNQWDGPLDPQVEPSSNANPWECHDRRDSATSRKDVNDNPWERGHASVASNDKAMSWNQLNGSADGGDKPTNEGNSWEWRQDSANTKYDDNNPWQRGPDRANQLSNNRNTDWNQCYDHVDSTERRHTSGNCWGYQERPGIVAATNASQAYHERPGPSKYVAQGYHGRPGPAKYGAQGYHDRPGPAKYGAQGYRDRPETANAKGAQGYHGRPETANAKYGAQGYHDRPGTANAKFGSQGGAWSKTCEWKPHSYVDKGKTSDNGGNHWKSGKGWQGSGESSWGGNQQESGISRSGYHNGSSYSANFTHGGASKDAKIEWGQRQYGQYGRPRSGFADEREDMAGRKREGTGQNIPGHKGPKLQYVDQTSHRWNNGSSNNRGQ